MKSRNKKRLLALVLCMVVAISNSSFIFASENGQTEYPQEAEVQTQDEAVADDMDVAAYAADEGQAVAEEQPAVVEQVAAEPETTAGTQEAQPVAEAPAAEQPTTEAPAAQASVAQASVAQEPATVSEGATTTSENTNAAVGEAQTPQGEENGETVTYNQEMNLKQDFKDELGNVVATVSVEIPEGAFQVGESSQITMEVNTLTDTEKTQLENLMKEKIPAEKELGQYVAYNIRFKVDDTETEALQPIKITMTGDKTQIDDVENATVFYLDPADPTVPGDKDELEEIIQRTALIKSLQETGQSIDKIDENYDLSDITLGTDGAAEKIQLEGRNSTIYGCYVSNVTNQIATLINPQVTITDDIMKTGHLKATPSAEIANLENVTYKWYKIINNGSETVVEQKKVGDNYSLADDGSWLNIAYDEGALNSDAKRTSVLYKVEAYQNSKKLCESTYYSVRYWNELQNGGFETPVVSGDTTSMGTGQTPTINSNWQYSNANYLAQNGVWQTTGEKGSQSIKDGKYYSDYTSADIEIINTTLNNGKYTTDYYWDDNQWASHKGAREGNQFAELNCEAEGALYQDVLTIKGETLNYWLSHRARRPEKNSKNSATKDTMYVVIIPTSLALNGLKNDGNPIDTQEEVKQLIQNKDQYDGVYVQSYTDTAGDWTDHTGTYTTASYLTRFFFVSGDTASRNRTVGNFLDRVGFSQKLPPANPGKYSIQLQKKVSGLSAAKFEQLKDNLQFTITSFPSVNGLNTTIKAKYFRWTKNSDGSYTGIYNNLSGFITNQTTVTITETNLDMSNYTRTSAVSVDGATAQTGTTTSFQLKEKDSKVVTFNNSYSRIHGQIPDPEPDKTVEVPHTKTIDYLGDGETNPDTNLTGDEYYRLYLDVTGIPDATPKAADVIFVLDVSNSMSFSMTEDKAATTVSAQRITKLKNAASAAANALMTGNSMVNVGVISFHTKVESKLPVTNNQTLVINYINSLNYAEQKNNDGAGGTNYQDAFEKAKVMLDSLRNNGRKKYVVFVSDGEPTTYTSSNGFYVNYDNTTAALNAQEAAENLTAQVGLNGFYTVMVGPSKGREFLEKTITPLPAAATNEFLDGTDEKKLNNTFSAIAGSITKQIGNVTISDQLSKYVELVADKDGKIDKDSIELKVTKRLKTEEVSKATPFTDYTWNYDSDTKTVSVNFGESYFLSRDTVYTVSFNVKLTQDAYNESMNAVGDSGTDYGENTTSSDRKGFWSNDLAKVTYFRVKDNQYTEEDKEYLHPVVQPKVSHSVEKKWKGEEAQSVEVQLKAFIQDGEEHKDVTTEVLGTEKVILSKANGWKYKWTNLPNKYYESGSSEGKDIIYKVVETDITQEEGVHRAYKVKTEESGNGLKTTITNSEQTKWEIIKKSSSENGGPLKGAEFQLKSTSTDDTYTAVSGEDGVLQWKDKDETPISSTEIKKGTYTLKETKAPVGYALNAENWTVDIQYKGALPTITDEKSKSLLELKDDGVYRCEFYNTPVYDLPSTGHTGIFNILMSGILLMFAGILIIYKMKGKEVLKK